MATHQINGFSYGNIKYKDSQGNTSNIRAVYYKDVVGSVLKIWPDEYWADNIVIKDLTSSQDINYSYDSVNNRPIYNRNGATLNGLAPGHDYVITGTIKRGDGLNFPDVNGCYFNHVTNQGANNLWYNGPGQQTDPNIINPFTGNADPYTVYRANYALVSNSSNLDEMVVLNYNIPDAQMSGMSFLGYGYGSANYQNATPIILRRNNITGTVMFFDDANDTTNAHKITNGTSLNVGQSITIWPKVWKYDGDLYEEYVNLSNMSNVSFTGGSGYVTIVNNNGSYTITATQASNTNVTLTFSCTVDGQNLTENLDLAVTSGVSYGVKIGNVGSYSFAAGNQSGTTAVTESTPINVVQSNDGGTTFSSYSGSFTITSGNSSIIYVSGNNIVPVGTGQTTVTVTVNGLSWVFTVNATFVVYMVHNLADSGNETFTAFDSNKTININTTGPYIIGFSSSNIDPYLDPGSYITMNSNSINGSGNVSVNNSEISINITGNASGSAVFNVSFDGGLTTYHTVTVNVSVS